MNLSVLPSFNHRVSWGCNDFFFLFYYYLQRKYFLKHNTCLSFWHVFYYYNFDLKSRLRISTNGCCVISPTFSLFFYLLICLSLCVSIFLLYFLVSFVNTLLLWTFCSRQDIQVNWQAHSFMQLQICKNRFSIRLCKQKCILYVNKHKFKCFFL